MASTNLSMPRPSRPDLGYGSWPNSNAPQMRYGAGPNLNPPPPYFDPGPMAAVPMQQPVARAASKGRILLAWCLWMLAIGLAAGPLLDEYADQGVEAGVEWLVKWMPNFLQPYLPKPLAGKPLLPQGSSVERVIPTAPSAAPTAQAPVQPERAPEVAKRSAEAKTPGAAAKTKTAQPERAPEMAKRSVEAKVPATAAAKRAQHEHRMELAQTRKSRTTNGRAVALAAAEATTPVSAAKPTRRTRSEQSDPFAPSETGANKAAADERPAKAAAEPAPAKSRPAKSGDTLDDLMAGATSGSQAKDRGKSSKAIDAMLQDVQKSRPAPRPARAEPEALPSLTSSDIAKVMAGVKSGAKACGKRFGQSGVADLRLTVGKDGKVTDVAVRGTLAGLPVSDCITQVVQGASFPPNSGLKFNYRIDVQ